MKNLNKVMLIGNLTHDPEVRTTPKGTSVADFALALNRSFPGENGERREETTFVDIVAWNQNADFVGQYLRKGRKAYVEGRLRLDSWEDKETRQPRHKLRVIAERVEFADPRPAEDTESQTRGYRNSAGSSQSSGSNKPREWRGGQHLQSQPKTPRQFERAER